MPFDPKLVTSFPTKHKLLTPSDSVRFDTPTSILVTAAVATVTVLDEDGVSVAYPNVPAYTVLPIGASALMFTGTTAGTYVGLFGDT